MNVNEQQYTINIPGKFAAWFKGTNLVTGADDHDPDCKTLRLAWEARSERRTGQGYYCRVTGNRTAMLLLKEYGGYCVDANKDYPDPAEARAAHMVITRVTAALLLKEPQS